MLFLRAEVPVLPRKEDVEHHQLNFGVRDELDETA